MGIMPINKYKVAGFILSTAIILCLYYYLVVLGIRTSFFTHPTSIGLDVVLLFHILAVLAITTVLLSRNGNYLFKWL
jgi:hypothetical protein